MKTIKIENKEIEISDESFKAFKEQFMKDDVRWKPEVGEIYYSIHSDGYVVYRYWDNCEYDNFRFANKNVYKTMAEAQRALDILNILNEYSYDFSEEEWKDNSIKKWNINYDFEDDTFSFGYTDVYWYIEGYFKDEETAKKVAELIGADDYKKYIVLGGIK